eukprot:1157610-Pelagomonas_calceolata.AAC.1
MCPWLSNGQVAKVEARLKAAGVPLPEEVRAAARLKETFPGKTLPDHAYPLTLPMPTFQLKLQNRELNGQRRVHQPEKKGRKSSKAQAPGSILAAIASGRLSQGTVHSLPGRTLHKYVYAVLFDAYKGTTLHKKFHENWRGVCARGNGEKWEISKQPHFARHYSKTNAVYWWSG